MYKNKWNIMEKIEPMLVGNELKERLTIFPAYEDCIRNENQTVRLLELNNLSSFYLPSDMSIEIYTKLYLAMVRSLQKKESKIAVMQRNINTKNARLLEDGACITSDGVIGGTDSFSIIGNSGIGKTTAISKAVQLMGGERVIEMENPYCKIIPIINVQCPFDCSAKSMLFEILQKIDIALGTSYYENAVKSRANINTMLISTAQILLNHVAVVCIDEIQNLIKHRAGMQLVSMLTELLNESGISIVFIGTPEIEPFFEGVDYLARRTLGLHYDKCSHDDYFRSFCTQLWKFQYVNKKQEITDDMIYWLYQHSAGTLAHVVFLFQTAQEISILDEREVVDIQALEEAYQRMRMLHIHIQPDMNLKKTVRKKKKSISDVILEESREVIKESENEVVAMADENIVQHSVSKAENGDWSFENMALLSKKEHINIVELLKGKTSIIEIVV